VKGAFLGVDFATQSARATLIDETGALLSNAKEDLAPVLRGGDGRLTQDPASWLVAIDQLLNISIARAGQLGYQIAGERHSRDNIRRANKQRSHSSSNNAGINQNNLVFLAGGGRNPNTQSRDHERGNSRGDNPSDNNNNRRHQDFIKD